jgi:hypothetical protein
LIRINGNFGYKGISTKKTTAKTVSKKSNSKKAVKKNIKTPVKKTTRKVQKKTVKKVVASKKVTNKKSIAKKSVKKVASVSKKATPKKGVAKVEEKPKYKPKAFTIKTGPSKPKVVEKPKKVTTRDQNEQELIQKGKERGFITYDEIIRYFPTIELDILYLEELYEKLSQAGVDILEGGNLLDIMRTIEGICPGIDATLAAVCVEDREDDVAFAVCDIERSTTITEDVLDIDDVMPSSFVRLFA